jgi:hypothetical protein
MLSRGAGGDAVDLWVRGVGRFWLVGPWGAGGVKKPLVAVVGSVTEGSVLRSGWLGRRQARSGEKGGGRRGAEAGSSERGSEALGWIGMGWRTVAGRMGPSRGGALAGRGRPGGRVGVTDARFRSGLASWWGRRDGGDALRARALRRSAPRRWRGTGNSTARGRSKWGAERRSRVPGASRKAPRPS